MSRLLSLCLTFGLLGYSAPALAAQGEASATKWPDSLVARLSALALLQTLNADLLSHESATFTLERWCKEHHLARSGEILAEQVRDEDKPPGPEQLRLLNVPDTSDVKYRRVRLVCGARVLSEADNWYVPSRLTPAMNRILDQTDTSFGRVVEGLHFQRRTLSSSILWKPLPDGWDTDQTPEHYQSNENLVIPYHLLQHKAVLSLASGEPFSEVVETYTSALLDFPPPFSK